MIVSDHSALISDQSWRADSAYGRTVITYAMPESAPGYLTQAFSHGLWIDPEMSFLVKSFTQVTGRAADLARQAADQWEAAAGIELVEVDRADADIVLGLYDMNRLSDDSIAFAYFPTYNISGSSLAGDVFMGKDNATDPWIWLHEMGHALGLEHSHEGDRTLAPALDTARETVMSYNWQTFTGTLGRLDKAAIAEIYGAAEGRNIIVSSHELREQFRPALMEELRDYDGNDFGAEAAWQLIGTADVQGDGDAELIAVNATLGRWATLGPDGQDLIDFSDHGLNGETRIVGTYIDPLIELGLVVRGSPFDSQQRFEQDLRIGNLAEVLGAGDYDGDGLQELYFALSDGTAYLHAYMHADGNIRYANYQNEEQMVDFLNANGHSDWMGWIA